MTQDELDTLNAAGRLPSPKGVALALLRMVRDDAVSAQAIANVIKSDPALAGRVVSTANAGSHFGRRAVVSVPQALPIIGTARICRLALGLSLVSSYGLGECQGFNYQRYWTHSLVTGISLQSLLNRSMLGAAEEGFTIGLLARVGQLALATMFPEEYGRLLGRWRTVAQEMAAERTSFLTDRVEAGQYLLTEWGFPELYIDAVAEFNGEFVKTAAPTTRKQKLTLALRIASRLADYATGDSVEFIPGSDIWQALEGLGVSRDESMGLWEDISKGWLEYRTLLDAANTSGTEKELESIQAAARATGPSLGPQGLADQKSRVLGITDNASIRALIGEALGSSVGHLTWRTEAAVLEQSGTMVLPQLVIHDWPAADNASLECVRAMRASAAGIPLYIIVLGGADAPESAAARAIAAGADELIMQPVSAAVLATQMGLGQRVVELQRLLQRGQFQARRDQTQLGSISAVRERATDQQELASMPGSTSARTRLEAERRSAKKTGLPLSCLLVSINHLDSVAETFGIGTVELICNTVAELLREITRTTDHACCLENNNSFMLICPETDRADAVLCAMRLRASIQRAKIVSGGVLHLVNVTVEVTGAAGARAQLNKKIP